MVKHYPISTNAFSKKAALATRAAQAQDKFWEFHRALFKEQSNLCDDTILAIGQKLGLDLTKFSQDLNSENIKAMVNRDTMDGRRLGINATPSVFINGKYLERISLGDMIEAELNKRPSG